MNNKKIIAVDTLKHFVAPNTVKLIQVFSMQLLIGFINTVTCTLLAIPGIMLHVEIILNIGIAPEIYF